MTPRTRAHRRGPLTALVIVAVVLLAALPGAVRGQENADCFACH